MATAIVGLVVLFVIWLAARKWLHDWRASKGGCGGGCAGCPSAGMCGGAQNLK